MKQVAKAVFLQPHTEDLKKEIREAVAWGAPDGESVGLPHSRLTALLSRALWRIEELERGQK